MTIEEMVQVLEAFKDGKEIEYRLRPEYWRSCHEGGWKKMVCSDWNFARWEYRVRREPKEIWVNEYEDGIHAGHDSRGRAEAFCASYAIRRAVRYREVIDD